MFKLVRPPVVVEFPAHRTRGLNREVPVDRELRVFALYRGQGTLSCDCPRVVKADGLAVWHSAECPEVAGDA